MSQSAKSKLSGGKGSWWTYRNVLLVQTPFLGRIDASEDALVPLLQPSHHLPMDSLKSASA